MNAIWSIAMKELKDGLRNRWLVAITLIFALFSSGLAWFGSSASGMSGFTSISSTIVSLASLGVFLIPLIALLMAYDAIVGEDEEGTLLLLLTYPVNKAQLLIGKLLGHGFILGIATILGFGASAFVISIFVQDIDQSALLSAFSLFIISAFLLGMVFISFAYFISSAVSEKSKAAGIALILWFVFVLLFDLGLLGLLVATEGQLQSQMLPYLLLFNPADIFRLINLVGFEAQGNGVLVLAADLPFGLSSLFMLLIGWIILPLSGAWWRLSKRSI